MSDEELLIKYRKYKKKRSIIIMIIISFILGFALYLYNHFNNTSSSKINENEIVKEKIIKDEVAPVIILKEKNIEILKGDDINYLDYIESVTDDIDGNILDRILYENIDTSSIGMHSIIYSVSDSSGNSSQEILNVLVKEKEEENNQSQEQKVNRKSNQPKQTPQEPKQAEPTIESKPENNTVNQEQTTENKPSKKTIKYFLFSDGYTMANVAEVCAEELRKTNKTGICSPIQDENGIYLGMKLETN